MLSTLTDVELVEEIRNGNAAAFRALYYRHVDNIYGLVTRILGPSRSDRDDVVQEVFFQVHRSLKAFQGRSTVSTWLHRIAANVSYSHLRRPSNREMAAVEELAPVQSFGSGERRLDARRKVQRMYELLDRLSSKNRMVFTLYEFQGLTLDQISEILDIPLHTAASRLRRSRENLMRALTATQSEGKEL